MDTIHVWEIKVPLCDTYFNSTPRSSLAIGTKIFCYQYIIRTMYCLVFQTQYLYQRAGKYVETDPSTDRQGLLQMCNDTPKMPKSEADSRLGFEP